jgi:hypothetical protein
VSWVCPVVKFYSDLSDSVLGKQLLDLIATQNVDNRELGYDLYLFFLTASVVLQVVHLQLLLHPVKVLV